MTSPSSHSFRCATTGRRLRALALAVLVLSACRHAPTAPTGVEPLTLRLETPGFRLFAGATSDATLRDLADRLTRARPRMAADLAVDDAAIGTVDVRVWQDEAAWYATLTSYFGQRLPAGGYVTGPTELRVLATGAVGTNVTHELAHAISLRLQSDFANNPRWLWEAVALYENGELVDPRTLAYMRQGQPPSLPALNAAVTSSRQIYEVGYTLAEFVVARRGQEGLRQLVRQHGDTEAVLQLSPAAFEQAWYAFVRERYGL